MDTAGEDHRDETVTYDTSARPTPPSADRDDEAPVAAAVTRQPWSGWGSLAALAVSAGVLLAVVMQADIGAIAEEGWRDDATLAAAVGMGFIGLALAAVSWSLPAARAVGVFARAATLVAVLAAFGAVIVVSLADQRGGEASEAAAADPAPAAVGAEATEADAGEPPIGLENAFRPRTLTEAAAPILARQLVSVDLNATGRQLIAPEMGCRARDLVGTTVAGAAIGGTWAEPLVVLNVPVRPDGSLIDTCGRVMVRLPVQAGIARPFA